MVRIRKSGRSTVRVGRRVVRLVVALAVVAFVAIGMLLPILLGQDDRRMVFAPASVMAGPRDGFVISEPIAIGGRGGLIVTRGVLSLADASGLSGRDAQALLASGGARLKLERAELIVGPTDGLWAGAPTSPESTAEAATSPLVSAVNAMKLERLSVVGGTVRLQLAPGRSETLSDVAVDITRTRKSLFTVKGSVGLRGQKTEIDASLAVADTGATAPSGSAPLKLKLRAPLVDFDFSGTAAISSGLLLQGTSDVTMREARGLLRWLGFGWPSGPGLREIKIRGAIDWNGATVAFQRAEVNIDGNPATGTLSFRATASRPILNGTLAFSTLDLTPYIANWQSATTALDAALGNARGPFSLPLTQLIDADLRISSDRMKARAIDLGRGAATLSIKDGRLLADIAELEMFGSRVSGLISVDAAQAVPRYKLKMKLAGADLGAIGQAFGSGNAIQGTGDVIADLDAKGEWASDLARSATGKVVLAMKDGGRLGFDFRVLSELARANTVNGWSLARRNATNIEALDARFVLSDGVVRAEALSAMTSDGLLTATGGGNLKTGVVDLRLSLGGARARKSEQEALALDTVRDTVLVKGPWSEPTFRYEGPRIELPASPMPTSDPAGTAPAAPAGKSIPALEAGAAGKS